jgi:2-polyprenyl-6-methoxyphenol hydroxylase-like FAD-dependent oxidoreductase
MAPSGEGVNMALYDALLLGQILVKQLRLREKTSGQIDAIALRDALRAFEKDMMERAKEEMETSEMMLKKSYGPEGGAQAFKEMLEQMMAGHP